jgi:hypothetical protein
MIIKKNCRELEFDDAIDKDGDLELTIYFDRGDYETMYLTKSDAVDIIRHLNEVFGWV